MLCRLHAVRPSYLLHLFIAHSAIIEDLFNISSLSHFLYSLDNFLADAKTECDSNSLLLSTNKDCDTDCTSVSVHVYWRVRALAYVNIILSLKFNNLFVGVMASFIECSFVSLL